MEGESACNLARYRGPSPWLPICGSSALLSFRCVTVGQVERICSHSGSLQPLCLHLQVIEAHSKGTMTALSAHPNAPLLATATNSQVGRLHRFGACVGLTARTAVCNTLWWCGGLLHGRTELRS